MTKRKSKKKTLQVDVISKPKFDSDLECKEREKVITTSTLYHIRGDLVKEANTLFAGSTDASLMVRKIYEVFDKYVLGRP